MDNLKDMRGFEAIANFSLKKKIELEHGNGTKLTVEKIPVLVSFGAKFDEIFSERKSNNGHFSFSPCGVICPGETIIISRENLEDLIKRKMIVIFV